MPLWTRYLQGIISIYDLLPKTVDMNILPGCLVDHVDHLLGLNTPEQVAGGDVDE